MYILLCRPLLGSTKSHAKYTGFYLAVSIMVAMAAQARLLSKLYVCMYVCICVMLNPNIKCQPALLLVHMQFYF